MNDCFIKLKHAYVLYQWYTKSIMHMIEQYYDNPSNNNCLFIVNFMYFNDAEHFKFLPSYYNEEYRVSTIDVKRLKEGDTFSKIIYLHLEHMEVFTMYTDNTELWDYVDEIWCPWLENYYYIDDKYKDKFVFHPMRFLSYYNKFIRKEEKVYDALFIGMIFTQVGDDLLVDGLNNRMKLLNNMQRMGSKFLILSGMSVEDYYDIVNKTKYAVDCTRLDLLDRVSQNVVRIAEMLSMDKEVYTNPSSFNYFRDMIIEMDINEIPWVLAHNDDYKGPNDVNIASKFRYLTESDSRYNEYRKSIVDEYDNIYGTNFKNLLDI